MSMQKQKLRKKLIAERLEMGQKEVADKSQLITEKLMSLADWKEIHKLHIYTSLTPINEINTVAIQNLVAKKWPHIDISTSPARKDATMPSEKFDLIIVPVLGFDKNNYRLGMGGGWYDRFLATQNKAKTIGLAYSGAFVPNLPKEDHDIALHQIITDSTP